MKRTNVILVGFMGTGKTSVGREIAARRGMSFVDMDERIVQQQGKAVSRIFAEDGEPTFRAMERAMVGELAVGTNQVIAPGGGIVLNPLNIQDFAATGIVVCLRASVETLLKRLEGDTTRPLLAAPDKKERMQALMEARKALYDAVPYQVETSGLDVKAVADRILAIYDDARRRDA